MTALNLDETADMLDAVARAYRHRLRRFGTEPSGVYWRDREGQCRRFQILAGIFAGDGASGRLSVNDLGCGYGALFEYLAGLPVVRDGTYFGYDLCAEMIEAATARIDDLRATFIHSLLATHEADYSFASGTYNLNGDAEDGPWTVYVKASLAQLWTKSRKGLAFNMLDRAKPGRQRGLFYADSREYVDFCARNLSPNVSLIDNDPLPDWTILVRR